MTDQSQGVYAHFKASAVVVSHHPKGDGEEWYANVTWRDDNETAVEAIGPFQSKADAHRMASRVFSMSASIATHNGM